MKINTYIYENWYLLKGAIFDSPDNLAFASVCEAVMEHNRGVYEYLKISIDKANEADILAATVPTYIEEEEEDLHENERIALRAGDSNHMRSHPPEKQKFLLSLQYQNIKHVATEDAFSMLSARMRTL